MVASFSIVLASASDRRRELLGQWGYEFRVCHSEVDESVYDTGKYSPVEYAKALALAKGRDVADKFSDCVVIGADTVVDLDGQILGKPADAVEAEQMVRELFSRSHKVITGVAIVRGCDGLEIVDSDTTIIYPRVMSEEQIASHIEGGSWRGKSGAYAIKEGADEFIERIEGSLTNVMGLPMELLGRLLGGIG
ncbi:MAG: Maf family protein [Planctomycetota bacterium]|jgi:septum formation protein